MKTIFTLTLLAIPFLATAQTKVIEKPMVGSKSVYTDGISIERIEIKKDTTRLYMSAFLPREGNKACIVGDTYIVVKEQRLPLLKAEGIVLDSYFFAPSAEDPYKKFTLCFPEIDKDIESFDFIESDCPQCFKMWNISLTDSLSAKIRAQKESEEIAIAEASAIIDDGTSLEDPLFMIGNTTIKGRIVGYHNGVFGGDDTPVLFYINNPFTSKYESYSASILEDGTFETTLPLVLKDQTVSINIKPLFYTNFIARCGGTEELVVALYPKVGIDGSQNPVSTMHYSGDNADINNCLAKDIQIHLINDILKFRGMTASEYKEYVYSLGKKYEEKVAQMNVPTKVKEYLIYDSKGWMGYFLLMPDHYMNSAYNTRKKKERTEEFVPPVVDDEYNLFVQDLGLNSNKLLYTDLFCENAMLLYEQSSKYIREGILLDLHKVYTNCKPLNKNNLISEEQIIELEQMSNPIFAKYANMRNAKLHAELEKAKSNAGYYEHKAGETEAESLLVDLLKDHKGKVVLIDVWATWCGPCLNGIEKMKPVKSELESKGVDFIYIVDESSSMDKWNKMKVGISGSHHLVSSSLLDKLKSMFHISGFPSYFFINKMGQVAYTHTGHNHEEIISKINELIKD